MMDMWTCRKTCTGPACRLMARELRDALWVLRDTTISLPETVWATSIVSLRGF